MTEPQTHTETVLLVEDEPAVQALSRRILSRAGFRVLSASTPSEALRLAAEHPGEIDLLLSDVVMPGMNGPALAGKLAEQRPGLCVLFVSGYPEDEVIDRGLGEQGIDLLQKPFSPQQLVDRVRASLDRHMPAT